MKKIIIAILVIGLLGGAGWYFFLRKPGTEQGVIYKTGEIRRGDLENLISSTGTLSAVSTVDVGSQVSGTLLKVNADFNDKVVKGQVLAELDTLTLEAAVTDANANLMKAKAQLAQSRAELERNRALFEKGYLSESEFLTYQTALQVDQASVASAEAGLKKAQTNLGYAVITSPIDGIVIHRAVDPGQTIAASFQTPELFVIAEDLAKMQIEVAVDESDIGQVREGMAVRFEVQAYSDVTFDGVVRQVRLQPETVSNVVNYTVIVDADNTDGRLLPGMTATVDFIVDHVENALLIPNAALEFRPDQALQLQLKDRRRNDGSGDRGPRGSEGSPAEGSNGARAAGSTPDFDSPGGTGTYGADPGNGSSVNGNSSGRPGNFSRIYLQDAAGNISSLLFKPGVTDGAYTQVLEVANGPQNLLEYRAILSSSGSARRSGMFPMGGPGMGPPPGHGGGGMRRSGL